MLERLFLSDHLQKGICSGAFNPIVGSRMKSYNFIKRELYYVHFVDIFQRFRCNNFKTPSWEHLWWNLEGFWVAVLFSWNCDFTRDHFFKFLAMILSPQKISVVGFYFGRNLQYFWEKNFFVDVAHQVIVKNIKFQTHGFKLTHPPPPTPHPQEKLLSKSPDLLGLKDWKILQKSSLYWNPLVKKFYVYGLEPASL